MIILQVALWAVYLVFFYTVLWPVGVVISSVLSISGAIITRPSQRFPGRAVTAWRPSWAWLWGNEEDGVVPPALVNGNPYRPGQPRWFRTFMWTAFRNPVNNTRFVKPFGFIIDPAKIAAKGSLNAHQNAGGPFSWSYTTHGLYAGLHVSKGSRENHIGWKLFPEDKLGVRPDDFRIYGCGFGLKLLHKI